MNVLQKDTFEHVFYRVYKGSHYKQNISNISKTTPSPGRKNKQTNKTAYILGDALTGFSSQVSIYVVDYVDIYHGVDGGEERKDPTHTLDA